MIIPVEEIESANQKITAEMYVKISAKLMQELLRNLESLKIKKSGIHEELTEACIDLIKNLSISDAWIKVSAPSEWSAARTNGRTWCNLSELFPLVCELLKLQTILIFVGQIAADEAANIRKFNDEYYTMLVKQLGLNTPVSDDLWVMTAEFECGLKPMRRAYEKGHIPKDSIKVMLESMENLRIKSEGRIYCELCRIENKL